MTEYTLAQRVLEALGTDEAKLPIPRIVARIPDALRLLAETVANDPSDAKRQLLKKTFNVALVDGAGDLSALITGDNYLLMSGLQDADIFDDGVAIGSPALQYQPDVDAVYFERSPAFGYYAIEGTNIYTANVVGGLTFRASFVPTLASLPAELESELVTLLATLISGGK